ncbi:ADP-ribosylation factor-like protein 13B isoform X1 [Nasonia vitripennis]|uniref:ADP-ribosylation factor-like protein 13B n=2 Tax=Nasonia vitripennis TaxID=7425 RepID=A0A7M7H0K3_NASVI|nr:ADP-ribosylation factor-like protein 13B isoform X1 [Nasonia vitripennis]
MGNCIGYEIRKFARTAWKRIRCKKKRKKSIVLLVVGLDNAGKSSVVNYIFNKSLLTQESVVPTIGFRTVSFDYKSKYSIRLYDVGGGPQIRALWPKYYADVHGVIFVVDCNDHRRLAENTAVFQDLVCHDLISQKPVLVLGNKQDFKEAVDELDLIEIMKIEQIVNYAKSYTRVEICSCYPDKHKHFNLNKNIDIGFSWLIQDIGDNYEALEELLEERRAKQNERWLHAIKTWTAESFENSFEYTDSDSELYMKPIIPKNEYKKRRKRRRTLKSIFCITNNRTAPMSDYDNNVAQQKSTKELIRSMRIEELIRTTEIDADAVMRYKRPWIRRKKYRPKTAPAATKPFEVKPVERPIPNQLPVPA